MEPEDEMKLSLCFILPCILVACATAAPGAATPSRTPIPDLSFVPPTPTVAPNIRPCHPADLASGSRASGAAGSIFLGAWFTNTGSVPCYLQAWPQVTLLDPSRQPLEVEYVYWDLSSSTPGAGATEQAGAGSDARIGLDPGQSAGFDLLWRNWCGPALSGQVVIRVMLGAEAVDLVTDLQADSRCDAPSAASTVSVAAFQYVSH
jgi:hypothetical protein